MNTYNKYKALLLKLTLLYFSFSCYGENRTPTITLIGPEAAFVGGKYEYQATVSDPDNVGYVAYFWNDSEVKSDSDKYEYIPVAADAGDEKTIKVAIKNKSETEVLKPAEIKVKVFNANLSCKFKIIENETSMTQVKEGEDDVFRILGGMRVHLSTTLTSPDGVTINEHEWAKNSNNEGKFYSSYLHSANELTGAALKGASLNDIYWQTKENLLNDNNPDIISYKIRFTLESE